jgi:hypothetical protein
MVSMIEAAVWVELVVYIVFLVFFGGWGCSSLGGSVWRVAHRYSGALFVWLAVSSVLEAV